MAVATDIPPEIISEIASWIDARSDSFAFAQVNKFIATIVSPRYTHYRFLRLPRTVLCMWNALAADAALARNVRVLHICPYEERHILPAFRKITSSCEHCMREDPTLAADAGKMLPPYSPYAHAARVREEIALMAALKNMNGLTSFRWSDPDTNWVNSRLQPDGQDIWTTLATLPDIRDTNVLEEYGTSMWNSAIFAMSNLTHFQYETTHTDAAYVPPDLTRLGVMLRERCPRLQKLHLSLSKAYDDGYPPPDVGPTILSGSWPDLESLTLHCCACSPDAIVAFLSAHPSLRHLDVDQNVGCRDIWPFEDVDLDWTLFGQRLPCPPGLLPNLQTLACYSGQAVDILLAAPRAGEHIALTLKLDVRPNYELPGVAEFRALEAGLSNVEVTRVDTARW